MQFHWWIWTKFHQWKSWTFMETRGVSHVELTTWECWPAFCFSGDILPKRGGKKKAFSSIKFIQ
jgi:hypothetical protein